MLDIGKTAIYIFWGIERRAKIVDISRDGAIVFLDGKQKWMHAESILRIE